MMEIVTANVTHEMITPLMSVGLLAEKLTHEKERNKIDQDAKLISSTTSILLSEVKLLLDKSYLSAGRFQINLDKHPVNRTIFNIIEIFRL